VNVLFALIQDVEHLINMAQSFSFAPTGILDQRKRVEDNHSQRTEERGSPVYAGQGYQDRPRHRVHHKLVKEVPQDVIGHRASHDFTSPYFPAHSREQNAYIENSPHAHSVSTRTILSGRDAPEHTRFTCGRERIRRKRDIAVAASVSQAVLSLNVGRRI